MNVRNKLVFVPVGIFQPRLMFADKAWILPKSEVLHCDRLWPYSQTLDETGKDMDKRSSLFINYGRKKVYNNGPL